MGMIALLVVLGMAALAQGCTARSGIPPLEQRAQEINKSLMCPVCPGETIDQSQNALSKQMRDIVREKLEEGWTDEEIRQFFVDKYGPSVLMAPPRQGFSLLAWVLPPVLVIGAGVALYLVVRSMRRSGPPPAEVSLTDEERERYFRRIQEMVESGQDRGVEAGGEGPQGEKGEADG
jgi:cytochrome c-type biogenesis protein CcmH